MSSKVNEYRAVSVVFFPFANNVHQVTHSILGIQDQFLRTSVNLVQDYFCHVHVMEPNRYFSQENVEEEIKTGLRIGSKVLLKFNGA